MPPWLIKLFHSLGRKSAAKRTGIAQIPTQIEAEGHGAALYNQLREAGFKDADLTKLIKSEKDIIRLVNKVKSMQNQRLRRNVPVNQQSTRSGPSQLFEVLDDDAYRGLQADTFRRLIANTDDDVKAFGKRIIENKQDVKFEKLTKDQRKGILDMIDDRIKMGNRKFMKEYDSKFPVDEDFASGGIARVGFAGGLLARLYKGVTGLQHGAIHKKLYKEYLAKGMEKFKAYDKAMNDAFDVVNQKKLKIVENKMNEVNVHSDDYVDLIDEHIRLTDRETYKDIKRWKNTRPDLADKTRALHFPDWAKARYGEDYHGVLDKRQASALKEQSDEINKMYPDTDGGIQDLQQRMVDEIDDMNKANIDEIIEGRKKNASGGIAGQLHLNQGGRIGYATGTKKLGEGQYNPVGKGNWLLNMPEIDPRINPKWLKKKKRKGLAEILGV